MICVLITIVVLLYLAGAYIMLAFLKQSNAGYGWFEVAFWFTIALSSMIQVATYKLRKRNSTNC